MGAIFPTNMYVVAVLLLVSTAQMAWGMPTTGIARWHVHVINGLNNDVLVVHCKSRDDDLSEHHLVRGADLQWSFEVNFWGTTLFWCNFQKPGGYASFEVFWPESTSNQWLRYRCNNGAEGSCIWTAKDDGIYLRNIPDHVEELIHKWISY